VRCVPTLIPLYADMAEHSTLPPPFFIIHPLHHHPQNLPPPARTEEEDEEAGDDAEDERAATGFGLGVDSGSGETGGDHNTAVSSPLSAEPPQHPQHHDSLGAASSSLAAFSLRSNMSAAGTPRHRQSRQHRQHREHHLIRQGHLLVRGQVRAISFSSLSIDRSIDLHVFIRRPHRFPRPPFSLSKSGCLVRLERYASDSCVDRPPPVPPPKTHHPPHTHTQLLHTWKRRWVELYEDEVLIFPERPQQRQQQQQQQQQQGAPPRRRSLLPPRHPGGGGGGGGGGASGGARPKVCGWVFGLRRDEGRGGG
jgi:hypothetical protein